MVRRRAAVIEGRYVQWDEDVGPRRFVWHNGGGQGEAFKRPAIHRQVSGTTLVELPEPPLGPAKCKVCGHGTYHPTRVCAHCEEGK